VLRYEIRVKAVFHWSMPTPVDAGEGIPFTARKWESTMSSDLFTLRSSETLPLTRELAIAFRDMPASPTEREFNANRATKLRLAFETGRLLSCNWGKAVWKGKEVRMNGQHSARVLAELEPFPVGSFVHMDVYEPISKHGMAALFRQFDARVSGRSAVDCSHAYQGLFDEVSQFDQKKSLAAIKGINTFHRFTGDGEIFSGDELGQHFVNRSYDKFIAFVQDLLMGGKVGELNNQHILAAVYGTFLESESRAEEFWNDVKLQKKDGSVSQMLDQQLDKNCSQTDSQKKLKPMQLYGIAVRAWNAYLAGDDPPRGGFNQPEKKPLPEIHSV
jgi:hypothetical protein